MAGFTESDNFPRINAFQAAFGGVRDAFVSKLAEINDADFIFANGFE